MIDFPCRKTGNLRGSVKVQNVLTDNGFDLRWFSNSVGDIVQNPKGVDREHLTKIIKGSAVFRLNPGTRNQSEITKSAGENITLPVRTPYEVEVLAAPCEIHCEYR